VLRPQKRANPAERDVIAVWGRAASRQDLRLQRRWVSGLCSNDRCPPGSKQPHPRPSQHSEDVFCI